MTEDKEKLAAPADVEGVDEAALEEASVKEKKGVEDGPQHEPSRYDRLVLVILMLCNLMNAGHRQMIAVLLPAGMKCVDTDIMNNMTMGTDMMEGINVHGHDDCIEITDAQQGILIGPAFSIPFILGGIPLAQLSDRFRRTTTLTLALFLWSIVILCQAFTTDFSVVLALRMLLGAFEAGCNPAAYAILMSYWGGTSKAGLAFGTYALGLYLGFGSAYASASSISANSWRHIWIYAGVVGMCVSALTLLIKEPKRKKPDTKSIVNENASKAESNETPIQKQVSSKDESRTTTGKSSSFFLIKLIKNKRYMLILGASSCTMIARYSLLGWLATFYQTQHNLKPGQFGPVLGAIIVVAGGISAFSGGTVSDRFKNPSSRVNICTLSQLIPMPFWIGVVSMSDPILSYVCLMFAMLTGDMYLGVVASTLQRIVDPSMAARANQIFMGVSTLSGSCGPLLVGVTVQGNTDLATVLAIMCGVFFVASGLCFHLLSREFKHDIAPVAGKEPHFDNPLFGLEPSDPVPEEINTTYSWDAVDSQLDLPVSAQAAVNEAFG